jgi:putative endonuclease
MSEMNWIVYIVECNDKSLYTGITNNIDKRIEAHSLRKGSKYIRGRLPIKLVYKEICVSRSNATKRELEIKKLNKKEKHFLIKVFKSNNKRV